MDKLYVIVLKRQKSTDLSNIEHFILRFRVLSSIETSFTQIKVADDSSHRSMHNQIC